MTGRQRRAARNARIIPPRDARTIATAEREAEALLDEARSQLEALQPRTPRLDRARITARIWFSLEHAWALLTGAKPAGPRTVH